MNATSKIAEKTSLQEMAMAQLDAIAAGRLDDSPVLFRERIAGFIRRGRWSSAYRLVCDLSKNAEYEECRGGLARLLSLLDVAVDLAKERDVLLSWVGNDADEDSPVVSLLDCLDEDPRANAMVLADAIEEGVGLRLSEDRRYHLPGIARDWRNLAERLAAACEGRVPALVPLRSASGFQI